jgi:Domain of unknown function (DUF4333)
MTHRRASEPLAPPEPHQTPAATPPARRRGYWIPALIAMAVLLAIGLAFGAGDLDHRSPSTLAGSEITQYLAQGIQAKEGTHTPPDVRCPDREPVRAGLRFVCTVTEAGTSRPVHVVEIDRRGTLSWRIG